MTIEVTVLGCGSSAGVPVIGCECSVCSSPNPKNNRTRASILIKQGDTSLLIDTSPDLRHQALREKMQSVDGILITHFHADHVMGIDDIRSFNFQKNQAIPLYSDADTLANMHNSFGYVFRDKPEHLPWFKPQATPITIHPLAKDEFILNEELHVRTFLQNHGKVPSIGIRVGDFAYSTDVNSFPEESLDMLVGLDVWLVDCLRYEAAPTHAHLEMTLEWIERFKPKRAILTHMSHAFDYDLLNRDLPHNVEMAFDGMKITL